MSASLLFNPLPLPPPLPCKLPLSPFTHTPNSLKNPSTPGAVPRYLLSMASFQEALSALREHFREEGDGLVQGLSLDGESVVFTAKPATGLATKVTVSFLGLEDYPNCGAAVFCEDAKHEEALSRINEQLQDRAPLHTCMQKASEGDGDSQCTMLCCASVGGSR